MTKRTGNLSDQGRRETASRFEVNQFPLPECFVFYVMPAKWQNQLSQAQTVKEKPDNI